MDLQGVLEIKQLIVENDYYCNKIIKYEQNKYLPTNLVFSKFGYLFSS